MEDETMSNETKTGFLACYQTKKDLNAAYERVVEIKQDWFEVKKALNNGDPDYVVYPWTLAIICNETDMTRLDNLICDHVELDTHDIYIGVARIKEFNMMTQIEDTHI
jgi:hypothetical protein